MLKTIRITPLLQSQIDRVLRAAELYPNEDDGRAPLEAEQVLLAEEVVKEYARQVGRFDRLPAKTAGAVPVVVEVEMRRKRRPA